MPPRNAKVETGVGEIRTALDASKLEPYLAKHIPGLKLPLDIKQFKFGQSCVGRSRRRSN